MLLLAAFVDGFASAPKGAGLTVANMGDPPTADEQAEVLVLGAGMSGMAAAAQLNEAGASILVIEGTERVGGRVKSAAIGSFRIEEGANWVHAARARQEKGSLQRNNPVWDMVRALNLTGSWSNWDDVAVYDGMHGSTPVPDTHIRWGAFENALQCLDTEQRALMQAAAAAGQCSADRSLRATLRKCGWEARSPVDFAIEWYEFDYEWAHAVETTGTTASYPWSYQLWRDEDFFVTDQSKNGYASVVQQVGAPFLGADVMRFGSRVISIERPADGGILVTVLLSDGTTKTFGGKYAICTFSTGVLQHALEAAELTAFRSEEHFEAGNEPEPSYTYSYDADVHRGHLPAELVFTPPLPEWKKDAIAATPMGYYTKIFLQFEEQFWSDTEFQIWADAWSGQYPVWQNMNANPVFRNSNIFMVTLAGRQSYDAEGMSDDEVTAYAMVGLRQMYPLALEPIRVHVTRWSRDPWTYGAYSDKTTGTFPWMSLVLEYPVSQLFFSGEATAPHAYGFIHGAYYAGQRTADRVLACMGLSTTSKCPARDYDQAQLIADFHAAPNALMANAGAGAQRRRSRSLETMNAISVNGPRHSKKFRPRPLDL